MADLETLDTDGLSFQEQGSDPATPAASDWRVFFKSGGMYVIEDTGTVYGPLQVAANHDHTGAGDGGDLDAPVIDGYAVFNEEAAPAAAAAGTVRVYAGTDGKMYAKDDAGTVYGPFGSGIANPMTTAGDIIVGGASGTPARLGIGSALRHLRVNSAGTALEYADPPAGGGGGGSTSARYPVQQISGASSSSTTQVVTLPSAPTVGNLLVMVTLNESTHAVSSISQTNVSWTKLAGTTAGQAPVIEVWVGTVAASPGTAATITFAGTAFCSGVMTEWTGLSGTLDTSATRYVTTDPTGSHRIPIITPGGDYLVIAGVSTTNNTTQFTGFSGAFMAHTVQSTVGCYFGWPGTNAVYGSALGGNSATSSSITVSIM